MAVAPEQFCFGRWELDLQRRTLRADGAPVELKGRGFDLLALLVSRHGQAVPRDEIFARVWPGITVGENNLTVQISNVRKVLEDGGEDGGRLIVTVPGRGYKFAGEIAAPVALPEAVSTTRVIDLPAPLPAPTLPARRGSAIGWSRRWGIGAAVFAVSLVLVLGAFLERPAPAAPRLSIAVLPFRNLSPDRTQTYLADALTDDLTTDLAHIPGSTVIARESADVFRGQATLAQKIGAALHVRYLVDGSLHVEDGQYSVNVQLIDARNGRHLWASRLPPVQGKLAEVRDEIVHQIATSLGFQLDQVEGARSLGDRPNDPDALDLFLRARAVLDWDSSLAGLSHAQHMLEQAIAQQPRFGDALAQLGAMLLIKVHDSEDPDSDHDLAEAHEMITRALAITPHNALALAAQGRSLEMSGDCAGASASARTAQAMESSNVSARAVLASCAQSEGRLDEAAAQTQAILRLAPNSPLSGARLVTLGFLRLVQGQVSESLDLVHQALAGDEDNAAGDVMGLVEVGRLLLIAGLEMSDRHEAAQAAWQHFDALRPHRTVWRVSGLFYRVFKTMPGFQRMLDALARAGMPRTADEHAVAGRPNAGCDGMDFDETPGALPGGQVLDTDRLARLMASSHPLVIDLGRGVAVPPGAAWLDRDRSNESPLAFAQRAAAAAYGGQSGGATDGKKTIVVMSEGVYGCTAYTVASTLVAEHSAKVAWYRGGEEDWAASREPSSDRRTK